MLALTDLSHLFNAPPVEPLSRSPVEVLGVSGVDYLLDQLQMDNHRHQARTLTLLLPTEKISPACAEQVTRALHRVAELRLERERRELRNTYRYGWKVTGVALILLAICLALAHLFTSDWTEWMRPLTRTTFEYGFEIIGWVLLWHPIDVLVFVPLTIRARIAALQALVAANVTVRVDPNSED
jgi:hypothetical protein